MRASDLNRGVIMLTAASDATSASTVGTMIQFRLRISAWPSACRSRSPDSDAATGFGAEGAGVAITRCITSLSLPHPRTPNASHPPADATAGPLEPGRLHFIMVAAGL